jgi:tripeptide aminopeptidase
MVHRREEERVTAVINSQRLKETFLALVQIDSISKEEHVIGRDLLARLSELGVPTEVDDAGAKVGGTMGNIIARIKGTVNAEPLLLSAHMDTVEPGKGVVPQFDNGCFTSVGDTILGADDKSALAIILEVLECLREQDLSHGPLEVVFSICEEIGLLGAKRLDPNMLAARWGYVLDTRNPEAVITRAPAANHLKFSVFGKSAHAGSSPEKGINAIALASKAIAQLQIGRIDSETTCNIGIIQGGLATNIVPDLVVAQGEVRSHSKEKLDRVTDTIVETFERVVTEYKGVGEADRPRLKTEVIPDFNLLAIADDAPVVELAVRAAGNLGFKLQPARSGGGSDANVLVGYGIQAVVLGTGMTDVHTVDESVRLDDMVQTARLVLEIIRLHAAGN